MDPVRTSPETHYVTTTKPNRLMLFRETVAVYCENHTEHTDTPCRQNAEFYYVKAGGTNSNHWVLKWLNWCCYILQCKSLKFLLLLYISLIRPSDLF
jgi:hypothetical protein